MSVRWEPDVTARDHRGSKAHGRKLRRRGRYRVRRDHARRWWEDSTVAIASGLHCRKKRRRHWRAQHRFTGRTGVVGAHNCFFQVTIYWGLAGFLALLTVIWQAYRYCPKHCGNDTLALSLLGIVVSVGLMLLIVPNLYSKPFSLGLGLLVGARYWIWPTGSCRRHYPE